MGIGVIARDHHGSAIAMLCASKEYIFDPIMAEVVVAWRAVELACILDLQGIMLEDDSLENLSWHLSKVRRENGDTIFLESDLPRAYG